MTEIPIAYVIDHWANRTYPGNIIVRVKCPHCAGSHTHGGPSLETVAGHRVADCGADEGYRVEVPEGYSKDEQSRTPARVRPPELTAADGTPEPELPTTEAE